MTLEIQRLNIDKLEVPGKIYVLIKNEARSVREMKKRFTVKAKQHLSGGIIKIIVDT
ncbi:hypothetical protein [Exiguobacterium artemiae]|uniref:hypothetical protein n=1 Tax=Exiguobacterium artemiae TaxID=340145 RepID=UPI000B035693|nr:hypothetical protein [Exiguobacterium sibiricum]